jgi:hypothetical protein
MLDVNRDRTSVSSGGLGHRDSPRAAQENCGDWGQPCTANAYKNENQHFVGPGVLVP